MNGLQRSALRLPDGSECTVLKTNDGSGRPLLYIHGISGLEADRSLLSELSSAFAVLAPVLDGFRAIGDVPLIQRKVIELLSASDLRSPMLAGHAAGAAVAAELAATMPGTFSHLFLLSPIGLDAEQRPVSGEGVGNRLGHIDCRTTLVWGKQDAEVSMESILELARVIPSAGVATVPRGTGDMVTTLPAKVARAMLNGLRVLA
ncbi:MULTISPECIES: hypothetical protein [unclassified Minwuia]|uniref:alpha/beta fold hydrolase n=1 Tax=unclassified Minwuia TaxID=2618799 RepID=UPI002478D358|nr:MULTISPECIES: hypothetical protein [unclassified Minwuia]